MRNKINKVSYLSRVNEIGESESKRHASAAANSQAALLHFVTLTPKIIALEKKN